MAEGLGREVEPLGRVLAVSDTVLVAGLSLVGVLATAGSALLVAMISSKSRVEQALLEARLRELEAKADG